MKPLRFATVLAVVGLLFALPTLFLPDQARADSETEDVRLTDSNPVIQCIPKANNLKKSHPKEIVPVLTSQKHQGCVACHQSPHPTPGQGDRPRTTAATALVQNKTDKPIRYELKIGKDGDWKSYKVEPKSLKRHSWIYSKKNENKSPAHYLRMLDDPQSQRKLRLVATPDKKLGNLYYFTRGGHDNEVELHSPKKPIYRTGKG